MKLWLAIAISTPFRSMEIQESVPRPVLHDDSQFQPLVKGKEGMQLGNIYSLKGLQWEPPNREPKEYT